MNIFTDLPTQPLQSEQFLELFKHKDMRIERILSQGQCSPEHGWYDQDEHEWVMVLQGSAKLEFDDGRQQTLTKGDFVYLAPHCRHKVIYTSAEELTIWLAVFW